MIRLLYLMKSDGEALHMRSFKDNDPISKKPLPAHVRACVTLLHASTSKVVDRVYTLEQNDSIWAYIFFKSFAIVVLTTEGENLAVLKKMMVSLGRSIAKSYGDLIVSWSGNMGEFAELDELVDLYFSLDLSHPSEKILETIEDLVNHALEKFNVAYVGVLDVGGRMLKGNIPKPHLSEIQSEISKGVIKPAMDMVPSSIEIHGHQVQMFRVHSLTVAAASYRDESRLDAVQAVGEIAHSLGNALDA